VLTTGKASQPEKQSIDCGLISAKNAPSYPLFAVK